MARGLAGVAHMYAGMPGCEYVIVATAGPCGLGTAGRAITASSVPFRNSVCFSSLFCPQKARPEVLFAHPKAVHAFVGRGMSSLKSACRHGGQALTGGLLHWPAELSLGQNVRPW